jgi:rRNA maturation RNase YbeY
LSKGKEKTKSFKKSQILIKNHYPAKRPPLIYSAIVKTVKKVMNGEDCDLFKIDINLIRNSEIRRINEKFLNHNYYTDIITFPYSDDKSSIDGELFISLEQVKRNSLFYNDSYRNEFTRVLIHGCLHLLGYRDKTKKQEELIRKKENSYMSTLKRGGHI